MYPFITLETTFINRIHTDGAVVGHNFIIINSICEVRGNVRVRVIVRELNCLFLV